MQKVITDDMDALLDILPNHIKTPLVQQKDISELLEVVLDLGRTPEARFPRQKPFRTSDLLTRGPRRSTLPGGQPERFGLWLTSHVSARTLTVCRAAFRMPWSQPRPSP